ncbi:MAG: amino acid ABC transporter permease [Lachnospiraceae bacterium]|nr:amino acid ABC transporter permease [Lachnospiraceae bacterium]
MTTLYYFALTLAFAIPLGLVICLGSMSKFKPLAWLTRGLVWIIRGTPLMLQVIIVFYGPGLIFGMKVGSNYRDIAALIAFVINYAVYFSEIYRGGIESIPRGQYEAFRVLGMSEPQGFFRVVLLQVVKRIIPPMSNEIITLVKDTSLVRVIAITELIKSAENFTKKGLIWPLFFTGLFYLVFTGLLSLLFRAAEKKLDYFKA